MNDVEKALKAGAEWMEANKDCPDAEAFGCVAAAVADLARIAYGKKETAGDAAVEKFVQNVLAEGVVSETIFRDGKFLKQAASGIMSTLIKHGIYHREIDDVFQLVKDTVSNQAISASVQNVR